jgi:HNH endonuclease
MSHKTRSVELLNREVLRFWAKVRKGDGCWLWTGPRYAQGRYGQFTTNSDGVRLHWSAHVFAYTIEKGAVPHGLEVRHSCDNGLCVNPAHLLVGTRKQNMEDAQLRGRLHVPRPGRQQITVDDICTIRSRVIAGEHQFRVAADFGISKTFVSLLMKGKRRQYDAPLDLKA